MIFKYVSWLILLRDMCLSKINIDTVTIVYVINIYMTAKKNKPIFLTTLSSSAFR